MRTMSRSTLLKILVALFFTAPFACGGKKDDAPSSKPTDPKGEKAMTPPTPEPPKPEAPRYSPEAAKKNAAELASCSSEFNCKPYEALVSFGAQAAPELLALATDDKAKLDAR